MRALSGQLVDGRGRPRRRRARRARALRPPWIKYAGPLWGVRDRLERRRPALAERALEARLLPRGLAAAPREGHAPMSEQSSQRGIRARQTVAPRSISACAAAPVKPCPVRRSTRSTLTSRGRTFSSKAKFAMAAAVYGPTPGSSARSSGQPSAATWRRGAVERDGLTVVAETLPFDDHVSSRPRGRCGRRPPGQPALIARHDAPTRARSITSETRIAYGIARPPPGRSRPTGTTRAASLHVPSVVRRPPRL